MSHNLIIRCETNFHQDSLLARNFGEKNAQSTYKKTFFFILIREFTPYFLIISMTIFEFSAPLPDASPRHFPRGALGGRDRFLRLTPAACFRPHSSLHTQQ